MNEQDGRWITTKTGHRVFIKNTNNYMNNKIRNSIKKNSIHDYNLDDVIRILKQNYDKLDLGNLDSIYMHGEDKNLCLRLQELNGFNNKPTQLNAEEYDKLSSDDYVTMYRGFHDSISEKGSTYIDQFINGENKYGYGDTKYGVGHYFIDDRDQALYYGNYEEPNVLEVKIPKSAKGIEYNELREKFYNCFEQYNRDPQYYYNKEGEKITDLLDNMNYANTSALAIMDGYDYVYENNVMVILNRGILIVKRKGGNK